MSDNNDPKGTSLPDGFDNERRRKLWKKLQGDLPLEEKVSCWKREYRADLVQQLRDIETGNLPIGMWHLIGAIPGAVEPDEPGYRIDERFAEWLAEATTEDMDAHNLACELVAANLKADLLIPAPLRSFGADVLVGITSKPKKPKGRPQTNWYRDVVIVDAIERAEMMGICPTRNDGTDPEKDCGVSLVHEAATEVWEISYATILGIWTDRKKSEPSVARLQLAIGNLLQDPED